MQKIAKRNPKLVQAYILEKQMGGCELYHHIEGETWDHVRESWAENGCSNPDAMQVEPHHIFGGPHRWDVETNLIAVCRPVHDWAERYDKKAATIAAIWVKLRNEEFDRKLLWELMGKDPIGVLEGYPVDEGSWLDLLRMDIFEMVSVI